MNAKDTFVGAVERCKELPRAVREAARQSSVEEHSFDRSYIDFLDTQIGLSPRGPEWEDRLRKRREGLLPFVGQQLLRSSIQVGNDDYTVEVDPKAASVVYWEWYKDARRLT